MWILLQFHLHFLVVIQGHNSDGELSSCVVHWADKDCSDWRIKPERGVVYSSPPPFPVPNQIRLVQQTSNGKKRSVLKYSQDYNRKHESPFKKKKISKITVSRWVCKSKSTNSWYTGSSCNQAMQRVSSSLTQIIHLSYRCLFSGIPPRQRFTKGKYPVYVSNYIYHIKPAGTAGRQKRLHSTLISKGIELTF